MKFINVLLFKGKGIISSLIRWQTGSIYSHAAVLLDDNTLVESWQGDGVRKKKITNWDNVDTFKVRVSQRQYNKIVEFLESQIGKKYDYWAIIRFISRSRFPENDKWFCSELVYEAFKQVGINLLERIESYEVSPGLLARSPFLF
ncbi:MAG: YiiX/YebB-like N1pC/P60 family cysteine hydrolase [Nanoarchaeota archaeon]